MSQQNSYLKTLLSPARSGTFFAPFRSRSANPDGFDAKMKLWINAIEEWVVRNKKLTLSVQDIHQAFIAENGIRPHKECVRLVISEMKRRSRLVPLTNLKTSNIWSNSSSSTTMMSNFINPNSWLGWGFTKLVYDPAAWALSSLINPDQTYSDLTDMSILDSMRFVSIESLDELSQRLHAELIRISKAERQSCFEWQHLLELITPIINTIIDAPDDKELLEMLDILIEYLCVMNSVAIKKDNDIRLVKVANQDESRSTKVTITQKDVAIARLLRAKELITADIDKYLEHAQAAQRDAVQSFKKKEIAKAKSLLRTYKRLDNCANQKDAQLRNVEEMLDRLENTESNKMIMQAYKDGTEALAMANTKLEANMSIMDDMYDATLEATQLNEEMNQMLNDITRASTAQNVSLEDVLLDDESKCDDILDMLEGLKVCDHNPVDKDAEETISEVKTPVKSAATAAT